MFAEDWWQLLCGLWRDAGILWAHSYLYSTSWGLSQASGTQERGTQTYPHHQPLSCMGSDPSWAWGKAVILLPQLIVGGVWTLTVLFANRSRGKIAIPFSVKGQCRRCVTYQIKNSNPRLCLKESCNEPSRSCAVFAAVPQCCQC